MAPASPPHFHTAFTCWSVVITIVVTSLLGATSVGLGIYDLWSASKRESETSNSKVAVVPGPGLGLGVAGEF